MTEDDAALLVINNPELSAEELLNLKLYLDQNFNWIPADQEGKSCIVADGLSGDEFARLDQSRAFEMIWAVRLLLYH